MINVLILSAGRRVELIKCFREAKEKLGEEGKIVAVDISDLAPAIYFADKFKLIPRISDVSYIDEIISVSCEEKIDIIIPTIDTELEKLSENRKLIEERTGAKLLLSNEDVISICCDKNKTQKFFEENGFGVPRQIKNNDIENDNFEYPLFIKPENGSSSLNTFKIENEKELNFFKEYVKNPIIQEHICGTEFSVDVFCDFDGMPITIVPRKRIATRSGEIAKGQIVKDREIIDEVKRMMDILKPVGLITVQCIKTQKGIKYIEINPRFGGGAPMSIEAGADACEFLFRLLRGEKLNYSEEYSDGDIFLRFDQSIKLQK